MSKLLLITSDYAPAVGGVARYYSGLAHQLAPDVTILTDIVGEKEPEVIRTSWTWPVWPKWLPLLWLVPYYKFATKANYLAAGQVLPIGVVVWLTRVVFGFRYIVFLHGLDIVSAARSPRRKWLMRQILANAEQVVVNSDYTKSLALEFGASTNKIIRLYPCVTELPPSSAETIHELKIRYNLENSLVVFTVARLVKRKGIDSLITAVAQLKSDFPALTCVVIGDGAEREPLEHLAKNLGAPVIFTGRVDDAELAAWYNVGDIFALTPEKGDSDPEGFGIVYLEAQAAGKPVIGSYAGGVPEAVGNGGVLVHSLNELTSSLKRLLADQPYRATLGAQGKARVAREFTWARQTATLKQWLYENTQ